MTCPMSPDGLGTGLYIHHDILLAADEDKACYAAESDGPLIARQGAQVQDSVSYEHISFMGLSLHMM